MPVHQHTITGPALNPLTTGPVPNFSQSGLATATATAGAGGAHQNMPPFRALHYAIWAR
jgi:microcystin-dependent protein